MYSRLGRNLVCGVTICGAIYGGSHMKSRYSPVWHQVSATLPWKEQSSSDLLNPNKFFQVAACASVTSPLLVPKTETVSGNELAPGVKLKMFQFITCPFCCKLRAYLDYHNVAYNIVEVNSVTRKQMKGEWVGPSRKVPILVLYPSNHQSYSQTQVNESERNYLTLHDSSVIISVLESFRLAHKHKANQSKENWKEIHSKIVQLNDYYPRTPDSTEKKPVFSNRYQLMFENPLKTKEEYNFRKNEALWRKWVDKIFVHTVSPNLYRTFTESIKTFHVFSERGRWDELFSAWETKAVIYLGGFVMYFIGKKLKRDHNLEGDVRQSLFKEANTWTTELSNKDFVGGNKPHLGDLAMYGVLTSMEGCDAMKDLEIHNPKLKSWMDRMRKLAPHRSTFIHH